MSDVVLLNHLVEPRQEPQPSPETPSGSPKITVLIYTARADYPYVDPTWHCFDPVVKTLAAQTFKDFELVIVDMHYEKRPDWFAKNPQPFAVKHVPSSPNYWHERKRIGLCAQINRGFAWADGELIWMGGENNMFPPTLLERAWQVHRSGTVPVAWYAVCRTEAGTPHRDCPADFNLLGFTRAHVAEMDHRAKRFIDDRMLRTSPCHYQNYFGYSSVPTDTAVAMNGFDELLDGQCGLSDVEFGGRLDLAGKKMTLARDLYIVEPPVAPASVIHARNGARDGDPPPAYEGIWHQVAFKCHYAILLHNRATGRIVNRPLPAGYVEDVKARTCFGECGLKEKCAAGQKHAATPSPPGGTPADGSASQYIDESKYFPFCEGKNHEMAAAFFASPPVRDIAAERIDRRAGRAPFDRGFISP